MNKTFSFLAGALCGSLIGASIVMLVAPSSGDELRSEVRNRFEVAMQEGKKAMLERERELNAQFEGMKR